MTSLSESTYPKDARWYRRAIKKLGFNQTKAADELNIDVRTSRRYALGECPVPKHLKKVIEYRMKEQDNGNPDGRS